MKHNVEINYIDRKHFGTHIVRHKTDDPVYSPCTLARWLQRHDYVVWDTETTGLDEDSKIVSIGIVSKSGDVLVDSLINPGEHIPSDATGIHGVTDEMVAYAPTFAELYPQIRNALRGKVWVIYNKSYDIPRLEYECERYYLPVIKPLIDYKTSLRGFRDIGKEMTFCMMMAFAEKYGEWHDYFENYKWQSLTTAAKYYGIQIENAHNALADAKMTLELVRHMALDENKRR